MRLFKTSEFGLLACLAFIIILFGAALNAVNQSGPNTQADGNREQSNNYEIEIKKERPFNETVSIDPVAYYTRALFLATAILAVFTLILAGVTIFIWRDGKEVAARQQIASRRALMHAVRSARAAEKAVEANNDASERQLRAYLLNKIVEVFGLTGDNPSYKVVLHNHGQTPAHDVTVWARHGFAEYPLNAIDPSYPIDDEPESMGIVGPHADIFAVLPIFDFNIEQRNGLANGAIVLYIIGGAFYTDVFGKRRSVRFCYYKGSTTGVVPSLNNSLMTVYKNWNDAN